MTAPRWSPSPIPRAPECERAQHGRATGLGWQRQVTDPRDIESALQRLLPDGARRACLEFLGTSIETAARIAPDRWALTLVEGESRIRLNVAQPQVVSIQGGYVHVEVEESAAPTELVRALSEGNRTDHWMKVVPSLCLSLLPEELTEHSDALRPAHDRIIEEVAATISTQSPYARAHSSDLLNHVAQDIDRELPAPTYAAVDPSSDAWATAIELCRTFVADREEFEAEERTYKLEIAASVQAVFAAAASDGDLVEPLRDALADPPNNLINWRTKQPFIAYCKDDESGARRALQAIADEGSAAQRVDRFSAVLPDDVLPTPGARLSVAGMLLMGLDYETWPMFRAEPFRIVEGVLDRARKRGTGATLGEKYEHHRAFADELLGRLQGADVDARDMLDAQSLIWMLATKADSDVVAWRRGHEEIDSLGEAVEAFRKRTGYPTDDDKHSISERERFRAWLAPEAIADISREQLREVIGERTYGDLGSGKAPANHFISTCDDDEYVRLRAAISALLHSEDQMADRLDTFLDEGFKGVKEAAATKLLAIYHHDHVLPIFTFHSQSGKGKEGLMQAEILDVEIPSGGSPGSVSMEATERLRSRLKPHFGDDTWGMSRFLYDLAASNDPAPEPAERAPLDALARRLYVDVSFLEEVLALLKDKPQLIFYGPPGTGKTYIARDLARHIANGEEADVEIVQFHPSYSYEDFVEGYRPVKDETGNLIYELTPGPFLRIARAAENAPERQFVLLIDEINRGNLPRIFGELLFLLEYRDEKVSLMYRRPDEEGVPTPGQPACDRHDEHGRPIDWADRRGAPPSLPLQGAVPR